MRPLHTFYSTGYFINLVKIGLVSQVLLLSVITSILSVSASEKPIVMPSPDSAFSKSTLPVTPEALKIELMTVGISFAVGRRTYEKVPATMVRCSDQIAFNIDQCLVPFDTIIESLQAKITPLDQQRVELNTSFAVVQFNLETLTKDPNLGLSISIKQLQELLNIKIKFDRQENAIVLVIPEQQSPLGMPATAQKPFLPTGLPQVKAPDVSLSMVEQRITASGTTVGNFRSQGTLLAVGSVLGGSWYAEVNQQEFLNPSKWQINSLQYLKQTPNRDFFVGSQPTFWPSRSAGDFWGFTTIGRNGYAPYAALDRRGGADPAERLNPSSIAESISGYAEPGTLVRLMRGGEAGVLIAEQVVDASGRYRFTNIPVGRDSLSGMNYQLLLYPRGQLTATPRIETPRFTLLPELLPVGATSQIASIGGRRINKENEFFGQFTEFSGGLSQRWGISESLTVGVGAIYDNSQVQGVGELFFKPKSIPFQLSANGFLASASTIRVSASWEDYPRLSARWNYDSNRHYYDIDSPLLNPFRLLVFGDSIQGTNWGLQFSQGYRIGSTYGRVILQPNHNISWDLYQNLGKVSLSHRKNDSGTSNYLNYQINPWNSVVAEYNTLNQSNVGFGRVNDYLLTGYWRYQSSDYQIDGSQLWAVELGYGGGPVTSGPYASVTTSVIPGLYLQAKYQGANLFSNSGQFSLSLVSSLGTQSGFYAGNRRLDEMRSQGGVLIQSFIDRNNNGQRDAGEPLYTESNEFMKINHEFPPAYRLEKHSDRTLIRLVPGTYRVDLDPSGFPLEYQPTEMTMAVNVQEGSYTPILIPLQQVYGLNGIITNNGQPANGVKIEAVNLQSKKAKLSLTNAAGVYYLEGLSQGDYEIRIDGKVINTQQVTFNPQSQSLKEMNFQIPVIQSQNLKALTK